MGSHPPRHADGKEGGANRDQPLYRDSEGEKKWAKFLYSHGKGKGKRKKGLSVFQTAIRNSRGRTAVTAAEKKKGKGKKKGGERGELEDYHFQLKRKAWRQTRIYGSLEEGGGKKKNRPSSARRPSHRSGKKKIHSARGKKRERPLSPKSEKR